MLVVKTPRNSENTFMICKCPLQEPLGQFLTSLDGHQIFCEWTFESPESVDQLKQIFVQCIHRWNLLLKRQMLCTARGDNMINRVFIKPWNFIILSYNKMQNKNEYCTSLSIARNCSSGRQNGPWTSFYN